MNPQILVDGLIAGSMIGLGAIGAHRSVIRNIPG